MQQQQTETQQVINRLALRIAQLEADNAFLATKLDAATKKNTDKKGTNK